MASSGLLMSTHGCLHLHPHTMKNKNKQKDALSVKAQLVSNKILSRQALESEHRVTVLFCEADKPLFLPDITGWSLLARSLGGFSTL